MEGELRGRSDLISKMDRGGGGGGGGGGWCVCGARHRSGRRVTWANLDAADQPGPPGEQLDSPNLDGGDQPGPPGISHLIIEQLDSHVSTWAEYQDHGKVSWNPEDKEQGDGRFTVRSRKTKKEDRGTARQMAEKGKVGERMAT